MDKLDLDNVEFSMPEIARGSIIPPEIEKMILDEEQHRADAEEERKRELEKERRQFRHDWKIAIFSAFAGALLARPLWSGIDLFISLLRAVIAKQ